MLASLEASLKLLNFLGGMFRYISLESVKVYGCFIKAVRMVELALETTLCPLVYSGKGGVSM